MQLNRCKVMYLGFTVSEQTNGRDLEMARGEGVVLISSSHVVGIAVRSRPMSTIAEVVLVCK